MSITRKFLKGIGIEEDKIDAIIEAHTSVTERMQGEIDRLKPFEAEAQKLTDVQKDLDDAKATIAKYAEIEKRYNEEHNAFEAYKKDIDAQNTLNRVKGRYKELLKANNIDEKRFDAILRVTDFSDKKLNKEGKFENEDALTEAIKKDYEGFIVSHENRGVEVANPPKTEGANKMTKEQILDIKDRKERQKAMAENPELFGIN